LASRARPAIAEEIVLRVDPKSYKEKTMKFENLKRVIAMAMFTLAISVQLSAQDKARQNHPHQYHHYQLIDVGTFGGPQSFYASGFDTSAFSPVNEQGALVGWADTSAPDPYPNFCFTSDCYVAHAFQWKNAVTTDLGVLADGFSSAADGGINNSGLIAGTAENGESDPFMPGFPELRSVLWENGVIHDLGTLPGGYESYSSGINNRGQVVGVASNAVPDANSMSFPGYQARAFLWDKHKGMQDLGTLAGGTDAVPALINERGQVVGWSYTSSTPSAFCASVYGFPLLTTGSFIWDNKNGMRDLGSFGGTCTIAKGLNNHGQVVGISNLPGDLAGHPFVWDPSTGLTDLRTLGGDFASGVAINENGEAVGASYLPDNVEIDAVFWRKSGGKWQTTDLGTLNGSNCSWPTSINTSGQVVGFDCANGIAFLWEDGGPMVDLNTLVSPDSGIYIQGSQTINNRGEIVVAGTDANGNGHAVLLIPCDENHPGVEGCDYSLVDASAAAHERTAPVRQNPMTTGPRSPALHGPSNDVRRMLQPRLGPLSHIPRPITGSVGDQKTPIPHDSDSHLDDKIAIDDRADVVASFGSTSSNTATINSCPAIRCSLNHTFGAVCGVRLCHVPGVVEPIWRGYDRTYQRVCFYGC
jgi:probable HAF family extracellular repeat protein